MIKLAIEFETGRSVTRKDSFLLFEIEHLEDRYPGKDERHQTYDSRYGDSAPQFHFGIIPFSR